MILIVGCGFLGSHLLKYVLSQTNESVLATVRDINSTIPLEGAEYVKCDVANREDLIDLANKCGNEPLTVFYFAACHNVDYVYENPDKAQKINIEALKNFINVMPNTKKLFFASTDCVYGEGKELDSKFNEASPLLPVNEYGRQKLEAEKIILSSGFTVLRLPFMLGESLSTKPHFYNNIRSKLLRGETIEMINGMKRSVLSYSQTAALIYSLSVFPGSLPQIINVCGDDEYSKYEMGRILANKLNVPFDLVKSIPEEDGQKFFKDKRAAYAVMDNTLLKSLLGLKKIEWDEKNPTDLTSV